MFQAADTFGSYGARPPQGIALAAARAADRTVTLAIVLVLALAFALAGYSLWDSWHVFKGGNTLPKPNTVEELAALMAENPDVCAWLTIDNTNIDYPVVQGKDNFEYLSRDVKGESAASGSIFLDAACDRTFHEPYEVIMGHHMARSKMFGDLDLFLEKDFFNKNRTGTLLLPDRTLDLEIVAVLTADAYDGTIFGTPAGQDRMSTLVDYIGTHARYQRSGQYGESDQLIALSTCASSGTNDRTVLMCKVAGEHGAGADASGNAA